MGHNVVISAKDIKKTFRIPHEKHTSMKQAVVSFFKKKSYTEFNVLKGVSFDIYEGDFFGIVGKNGSGKSTLLKILAGIYTFDSGSLKINGKISPFLELGVGFNPELTGRENVFLNGAILGLSQKEIEARYDEIVSFAELLNFMDQRLKNYSSGMQVRLAFSVAIHAHAPIILLDEVLAVGDTNFQRKCDEVFVRLKKEGRTIVFVSHNMSAVNRFCNKVILINEGRITAGGDPESVTNAYEELNNKPTEVVKAGELEGRNSDYPRIKSVKILKGSDEVSGPITVGDTIRIVMDCYNPNHQEEVLNAAVGIFKDEVNCFDTNTFYSGMKYVAKAEGSISIELNLSKLPLAPGNYHLNVTLMGPRESDRIHAIIEAKGFSVVGDKKSTGICDIDYKWQ